MTLLKPAYTLNPYPRAARLSQLTRPSGWVNGARIMKPAPRMIEEEEGTNNPSDVLGKARINYDAILIHGKRGDGKSYCMTAMAYRFRKIWDHIGSNNKIFSNIHITFADMVHPRLVDEIVQFPDWCHDALILIDELAAFFPGQRAMTKEYLLWQTWLQQIRKLRVTLIFTTQYPFQVGAASNIQINWYLKPRLYNKVWNRKVRAYVADSAHLDVVDWNGAQTGFPIMHAWPPTPFDTCYSFEMNGISKTAELYNSDERVPPFFSPKRDAIMAQEWSEEIEAEKAREDEDARLIREAREAAELVKNNPQSLEAIAKAAGDSFKIAGILDLCKQMDPKLNSINKIGVELQKIGYIIEAGPGGQNRARKRE